MSSLRFELARDRIFEILREAEEEKSRDLPGASGQAGESGQDAVFAAYFRYAAHLLVRFLDEYDFRRSGRWKDASAEELFRRNRLLYEDILPENYENSYADPGYACRQLGRKYGQILSALIYELRSMIRFLYMGEEEEMLIRMELFLEVYGLFSIGSGTKEGLPSPGTLKKVIGGYLFDYAEQEMLLDRKELLTGRKALGEPSHPSNMGVVLQEADLSDLRYLYRYGNYISDNEIKAAELLNTLPEETVRKIADTYTEGYIRGFAITGKDLSSKHYVGIVCPLGFERIAKAAEENFRKAGKECVFPERIETIFLPGANACRGTSANPQYEYDHREDLSLFLNDALSERRIEALRAAYKQLRDHTVLYAGPAVIETFGEKPFSPKEQECRAGYTALQKKLVSRYLTGAGRMYNEAVIAENRSFTIISFPVYDIAEDMERYRDIFHAIIRINTLEQAEYEKIQQRLIDVLDTGDRLHITGRGKNRTDLTVELFKLRDPDKETIFENCLADVNIPLGEVFTTPELAGTQGILHVSRVYLNGLEFRDLVLRFEGGCVADYSCGNFEGEGAEEAGRRYIEENILFHHPTLPMGECAIGTNTTAYAEGIRYGISDRYSILIAEKTGPHFAVGDTCYMGEEENVSFNPDGKRIVARENDFSRKRHTDPEEAYFSCHTDITIPYDELDRITVIRRDGSEEDVIRNGRFVTEGTQKLNIPLDEPDIAGSRA